MRILITGGAGFMGSHLAEACLRQGHEVRALDDLSTGREENLAACLGNSRFQFIRGSILDADLVDRCVKEADFVYHLAAAVGVRLVVEKPIATIATNVLGARNAFEACARHRRKVVLASTSEVYGRNPKAAFSESDDLVLGATSTGRWAYACTKALDEFLAFAHGKEQGLRFVVARYFNTIGPRQLQDYGMVVPRFIAQARRNQPLTVFGDGSQSRCFLHVADAVAATLRLAETAAAEGRIVNVGNPRPVSILDLARLVMRLSGSSSPIRHVDPHNVYDRDFEDMAARAPDITLLKTLTGFTPQRTLEDALRDILDSRDVSTPN